MGYDDWKTGEHGQPDPGRSAKPTPEPWKCLDCAAAGKGYVSRGQHWHATHHHIVAGFDPRAKTAPREKKTPQIFERETVNAQDK